MAPMELAILNNVIAEADFQQNVEVPIEMTDSEKTQHSNEWRSYRERNAKLETHRGQAFSLILGQWCTQLLQDRMKQDTDWNTVSMSYNPLALYRLIEKTILAQTEDHYPFATVYDQEQAFYSFRQDSLSNPQWYERFNTKVDVGAAIGVTRQHRVLLLEYVAMELHYQAFAALGAAEQQALREDTEERFISYAFQRQSGAQHGNLKVDLQNDFTSQKNIAALKGKTTRSKPNPVARDFVKVPVALLKLHKEVFLTVDIFFVNKIPFFLTLSRKICFTAVNHLADRTVPQIFKAFVKKIY
jgi:hypothetical protein